MIGLVRTEEDRVARIDSGNNRDAGKKIRKHPDANGRTLAAIFHTHAHADHMGGNPYLRKQTGWRVSAPGIGLERLTMERIP